MFVSRSMVSQVITIDKEASIFEAQEKMAANKIRHLPIVDADNRPVGPLAAVVGFGNYAQMFADDTFRTAFLLPPSSSAWTTRGRRCAWSN